MDTYKTMTISRFVFHARPVGELGDGSLEITFTTHAQNTIRMLRCAHEKKKKRPKRSCRQLNQ